MSALFIDPYVLVGVFTILKPEAAESMLLITWDIRTFGIPVSMYRSLIAYESIDVEGARENPHIESTKPWIRTPLFRCAVPR